MSLHGQCPHVHRTRVRAEARAHLKGESTSSRLMVSPSRGNRPGYCPVCRLWRQQSLLPLPPCDLTVFIEKQRAMRERRYRTFCASRVVRPWVRLIPGRAGRGLRLQVEAGLPRLGGSPSRTGASLRDAIQLLGGRPGIDFDLKCPEDHDVESCPRWLTAPS